MVPEEHTENHSAPDVGCTLDPGPAESQFLPSPCCAILSAGLGTISSTLSSVIGGALNTIRSTLNSIDTFQRTVVWPQVLIDRARAAVGAIEGIFDDIRALGPIAVASATLPQNQGSSSRRSCRGIRSRLGRLPPITLQSIPPFLLPPMRHLKFVTSST